MGETYIVVSLETSHAYAFEFNNVCYCCYIITEITGTTFSDRNIYTLNRVYIINYYKI